MAEVYLARRRSAGIEKLLVVKRMRPERSGDARFLDLFVREARLSMSLAHQNIVPVFDFGKIDDQVFLAMERVEGKDLGSSLARAKTHRLPPLLAAFIAAECCQALDYAHQRKSPEGIALGIVHRDVTPRNVLLSWSGEVKLTDFGIAALAGDATSRLLGTPQYMAPEQARGEPIDPRADIYAIGLVLREAVSGVRPRPGSDRETILDAARRGELLPWSAPAASTTRPAGGELALGSDDYTPSDDASAAEHAAAQPPEALVAIIDRATAAQPDDRYPDVRSMLEELDSFIVSERAAHKAESPSRQLAAWLAGVWEGARDDGDADAAIDAEHLVSFLDDGAFDVLGTGTIRSLAATAAEDVPAASVSAGTPSDPDAASGAGAPSAAASSSPVSPPSSPSGAPATASASAARSTEPASRPGRISSSNATIASGSFHTISTSEVQASADKPPEVAVQRRKPRQVPLLASILFVGVAVIVVVFLLTNNRPERGGPSTGEPSGSEPITVQPSAVQPDAVQPDAVQPDAVQPDVMQPDAMQPDAMQPDAMRPDAGQPHSGQPHTGQPHTDQQTTGQPSTGHPGSQQSTLDAGLDDSGGVVTAPGEGSNRTKPAVCRVRINLTPWAYYAAEDGARHETPSTIELTPGPHRIHVWNPELHVERDITINVPADRDTMNYSEPLQPSTLAPDAGPTP
jgi:serine/threonine protein kinase